jgi:hypothetical protein
MILPLTQNQQVSPASFERKQFFENVKATEKSAYSNLKKASKRSLKRRVRFSTSDNTVQETLSRSDFTAEEMTQTWYTDEEFTTLRKSTLEEGTRVRKEEADRLQALIETFETSHKLSSKIADETTLVAVQQNLDMTKAGLTQWVVHHGETHLRGLEKFSSLTIRKARLDTREDNSQIVFDSTLRDAASLSTRYQEMSQPARIFARMMGICDQMAAAAEN